MFLKVLFQVTEIIPLNLRIFAVMSTVYEVFTMSLHVSLRFQEGISDIYFGCTFSVANRDIFSSAFQSTQAARFRIALLAQFEDAPKEQL